MSLKVFIVKEIRVMDIEKETLQDVVNACKTKKEVIEKLGFNYSGGTRRIFREKCRELGVDITNLDNKLTEEKYNLKPKHCLCCGKVIPYSKRVNDFCDSSCAATYNNTRRPKKIKLTKPKENTAKKEKEVFYCKNCGKQLTGRGKLFCSRECENTYHQNEYIEKWKRGEVDGLKGEYGLSKHIKRYLLEKHNFKCERCGWGEINEFTKTIPLEIHHIDGNYRNNREENLQVLCPNCHSLTETHKSHNKNGRTGRNKYYYL